MNTTGYVAIIITASSAAMWFGYTLGRHDCEVSHRIEAIRKQWKGEK